LSLSYRFLALLSPIRLLKPIFEPFQDKRIKALKIDKKGSKRWLEAMRAVKSAEMVEFFKKHQ